MFLWRADRGDAYALLTSLLAEAGMGSAPEMARREGGKPFFPTLPNVCFNVSHSGGLALCALSEREIGVDIEIVRPRRPSLPRHVLGADELAWYEERGQHWEDFYSLWTLKEAKVKCTGDGLLVPPRTIAVPPLSPGEEREMDGFRFLCLSGSGWRGAVCEKI